MSKSPWNTPTSDVEAPTSEELSSLKKIANKVRSTMRIGYKTGIDTTSIAKLNAHLFRDQLAAVEFVKFPRKTIQELSNQLAKETRSQVVGFKADTVVFFRKHPQKSVKDLLSSYED